MVLNGINQQVGLCEKLAELIFFVSSSTVNNPFPTYFGFEYKI
jgi:hypothetical protein